MGNGGSLVWCNCAPKTHTQVSSFRKTKKEIEKGRNIATGNYNYKRNHKHFKMSVALRRRIHSFVVML